MFSLHLIALMVGSMCTGVMVTFGFFSLLVHAINERDKEAACLPNIIAFTFFCLAVVFYALAFTLV